MSWEREDGVNVIGRRRPRCDYRSATERDAMVSPSDHFALLSRPIGRLSWSSASGLSHTRPGGLRELHEDAGHLHLICRAANVGPADNFWHTLDT